MAELYDQVRQSNSKYVPQFVGSNFDTLKSLGDTLQDRYNKNLDISNALAIQMANDQYLEQDQAIGEKHYNQFSKAIDEIAGEYAFPAFKKKFNGLISEGEIEGLCGGAQGIYLNGTPLQNPDLTFNFAPFAVFP
jgi:hypothetical protein